MVKVNGKDGYYEIENGNIIHYGAIPKRARGFEKVSNAPEDTKLPVRKTKGSACYDMYMPKTITLPAHSVSEIIPSGIKAFMQDNEVLLLFVRSSIGLLKHITLENNTGVIDSSYYNNEDNEGNIGFAFRNNGNEPQTLSKGERVVQAMFTNYLVTDDDNATEERKGGIGSTGM